MNSWTKAGNEPDVLCSSSAIGVILPVIALPAPVFNPAGR